MIFEGIAELSIRHHKKVIAFWVVLFIASLPFFLNLSDVLEYNETGMLPSDSEVVKAADVIEEQFPGLQSNSSVMVVLSAENVTTDAIRDYCLEIGSAVSNESDVPLYDSFLSFYSMEIMYMAQFGAQMGPAMFATIDSVQQISGMIYGVPAAFIDIRMGLETDPSVPASQKDGSALNSTLQALSSEGDPSQVQMLQAYMRALYQAYSSTYDPDSQSYQKDGTTASRMDAATRSTAPAFFQFASPTTQQQRMMALVYSSFGLDDWNSMEVAKTVTFDMLRSAIPGFTMERTFFQGIYGLGRNATMSEISTHAVQVVASTGYEDLPLKLPYEIVSQFISPDNRTMLLIVGLSEGEYSTSAKMKQSIDGIRSIVDGAKDAQHLEVETYLTGSVVISYDTKDSAESTLKTIEPVTVVLLLVIIGLIFLSVLAPTIPLGIIFIAITITQAIIYFLAMTFLDVQYMITTILFTVTMGAGVDYCIFILARYREERMKGRSKEDAVRESVRWAGESITTSGLAVIIGFGALSLARFEMLKVMGLLLALAILMALVVSLTLLPSFIMLIGNTVFWPSHKRWMKASADKEGVGMERTSGKRANYFQKAGTFAIRRYKLIVPIALLVTLPAVYMVLTLDVSYDSIEGMPPAESKTGMERLGDGFGEGIIMPTSLVVRSDTPIIDANYSVDVVLVREVLDLTQRILLLDNVRSVETSLTVLGQRIDRMDWTGMSEAERELYALQAVGKDRRSVDVRIVLSEGPFTKGSLETVKDIRDEARAFQGLSNTTRLSRCDIYVGGSSASMHDINQMLSDDFKLICLFVVIGIFVLLVIVLRGIVVSLISIVSIALAITWSLTAAMLLFERFWGEQIQWILPIMMFSIMMGLGMDYNIFLITRIREERLKGRSNDEAIVEGISRTGGIIMACGAIMATAFGTLILAEFSMLKQFGFALVFAIAFDAVIVMMFLMPALMKLTGEWNWWIPLLRRGNGR